MEQWERVIEEVFQSHTAPIVQYLYEKHQIGLVELSQIKRSDNDKQAGIELIIDVAAHFEVVLPEVKRLCLEIEVHMRTRISRQLRKDETHCGPSGQTVKVLRGTEIFSELHNPYVLEPYDRLIVQFNFWELPFLFVTTGLDGPQINFKHWADRWWLER